jgi:hypothetical protein
MRTIVRPAHRGLVYLITLGVLIQAILAGQFVSGASDQLGTHGAVGGTLELAGLVLLLIAAAHRLFGEGSRLALWGSVALGVALQVQAALGWMPGAVATSIHVPLGVFIFAGALGLSATIGRHLGDPHPPKRQRDPRRSETVGPMR